MSFKSIPYPHCPGKIKSLPSYPFSYELERYHTFRFPSLYFFLSFSISIFFYSSKFPFPFLRNSSFFTTKPKSNPIQIPKFHRISINFPKFNPVRRIEVPSESMADCRSLIEFLRAFEQHRKRPSVSSVTSRSRRSSSRSFWNPLSHPFCDHSPFAAIDALLLFLVLFALAFLALPYLNLIVQKSHYLFNFVSKPYLIALISTFVLTIVLWEVITHQIRKCGKPFCKGLKKAVEFDIQLETEECVKHLKPIPKELIAASRVELSTDHKELEAELRKMAPLNGRTVLVFRAPCGCPKGRMEVWGQRKVRRIKK
ncbi:hypothetical protein LUZ60_010970 [Juncus effusus]|nr:hypothetical protein LUZ60_010970 [Juncus effusus]